MLMGMRMQMAGLLLLGLCSVGWTQSLSIEREVRIRALALGEGGQHEQLGALLASDSWGERVVALEALARGESAGLLEPVMESVRACLVHPQPNVRAQAICALVRGGALESLSFGNEVSVWAQDPHPLVRMAAARSDLPPILFQLTADSDPRVAAVARWRLMAGGPAGWREQRDAILWGTVELVDVLEPLTLGGVAPELAEALRASELPQRTLIEGLCVWAGLDPQIDALLEGFCEGLGDRPVLLQRREVARLLGERPDPALGQTLGVGLLERARGMELDGEWEAQLDLALEGAALCMVPAEAARLGQELDDDRALIFWQTLGGRRVAWRAAELKPWLLSERDAALRFDIALFASGQLNGPHQEEWVQLFLHLVQDSTPGLRLAAFRWLSDADLTGPQEQALRDRWAGLPGAVRRERLRDLPRNRPMTPFREDLLDLLGERHTEARGAIELLARFKGDLGVAKILEAELAVALGLVDQAEASELRARESGATDLLQALARVDPTRAIEPARRALALASQAHSTTRHELGKAAISALSRDPACRVDLEQALAPGVPRRLRFEAALQGVRYQKDPLDFGLDLARLFGEVDSVLQLRAVRGLARLDADFFSTRFVNWISDPGGHQEVQVAAIEALGKRGALAELTPLLQVPSPDLRLAVVDQLCNLAGSMDVLRAEVIKRLGELRTLPPDPYAAGEILDLLRALACRGPLPTEWLRLILERPMASAGTDLVLRFRGESLPGVLSTWRPELEAFRALAQMGQAEEVLAAAGEWWSMDARLLYELAHFSRGDKSVSGRLLSAARISLAGEQDPRSSLQVRWLRAGPGTGDPRVIKRHLAQTLRGLSLSQRGRLGR